MIDDLPNRLAELVTLSLRKRPERVMAASIAPARLMPSTIQSVRIVGRPARRTSATSNSVIAMVPV